VTVDEIFADACAGTNGELIEVGPTVHDLAAALLTRSGQRAEGPYEDTLGGYPALRFDLYVPKNLDLKACNLEGIGLQIWYSAPSGKYFVLLRDGIGWVYILNVDGQRQVFLAQHRSPASPKSMRELSAILESIRIET
jgi:hypothetical protein